MKKKHEPPWHPLYGAQFRLSKRKEWVMLGGRSHTRDVYYLEIRVGPVTTLERRWWKRKTKVPFWLAIALAAPHAEMRKLLQTIPLHHA